MRAVILALALVLAGQPHGGTPSGRLADVTFRATEYAFTGPDSIAPGVTMLHLVNAGREAHQLALYHLAPNADPTTVMRTLLANRVRPPGIRKVGGVESVQAASADSVIILLTPGRYVLLCGFPAADGQAHVTKGMMRLLVVRSAAVADGATAALPPANATVRMTEYTFTLSAPLRAGAQRVRVENTGRQHHNFAVVRLHRGVTLADVDRWDGRGAPPFDGVGGVAALDPGEANVWPVALSPGNYLISCVMSDAGDGRPHFMHGMERVVRVGGGR